MKRPSPSRIAPRSLHSFTLGVLLSAVMAWPALATDPATLKLFGRWTGNPANYKMGFFDVFGPSANTMAATESWILVGASQADEQAVDQGAVQVFNGAGDVGAQAAAAGAGHRWDLVRRGLCREWQYGGDRLCGANCLFAGRGSTFIT